MKLFGVSTDSVESHKELAEKLSLPFSLLADTEGAAVRAFDAKMPAITIASRKIVLMDSQGKIAYRDDDYDLSTKQDFEALKEAVRKVK